MLPRLFKRAEYVEISLADLKLSEQAMLSLKVQNAVLKQQNRELKKQLAK